MTMCKTNQTNYLAPTLNKKSPFFSHTINIKNYILQLDYFGRPLLSPLKGQGVHPTGRKSLNCACAQVASSITRVHSSDKAN